MFRTITIYVDRRVAETRRGLGWLFSSSAPPPADNSTPWKRPVVLPETADPTPPAPRQNFGWLFSTMAPPPPPPPSTAFPGFVRRFQGPPDSPPEPVAVRPSQGWLFSPQAPPPPPPTPTTFPAFVRRVQGPPDSQPTYTGPQNPSRWHPGIPSPSPFTQNLLAGRIVPRVPIRTKSGQGGQGGDTTPEKIDPRSVRFTEIVSDILNGLIGTGAVFKSGVSTWGFSFIPRQITPTEALNGEVFYNSVTNVLCFRDPGGAIHPLY